jgi:uncharacterized membrane protein
MAEIAGLLASTVLLRPYVFLFLALYLWAASAAMGWRRTATFTAIAWSVAFVSEYASTRIGIPFGYYSYTEATRGRELYISNVPFMDSLSFTFLAYVSFALAQALLLPARADGREIVRLRQSPAVLCLGAFLFMLIDIVIDPVALRGDRWFLGKIYEYPSSGIYFGIPLPNFAGWAVVGLVIIALFQRVDRRLPPGDPVPRGGVRPIVMASLLYYLILIFNLSVTFAIGEHLLGLVGTMLYVPVTWLFVRRHWRTAAHSARLGQEALRS